METPRKNSPLSRVHHLVYLSFTPLPLQCMGSIHHGRQRDLQKFSEGRLRRTQSAAATSAAIGRVLGVGIEGGHCSSEFKERQ